MQEQIDSALYSLGTDCLEKITSLRDSTFHGDKIETVQARRKALIDCGDLLHYHLTKLSISAKEGSKDTMPACVEISKCKFQILSNTDRHCLAL
jgi:hypothetical protein